jgi:hypothetical protein
MPDAVKTSLANPAVRRGAARNEKWGKFSFWHPFRVAPLQPRS